MLRMGIVEKELETRAADVTIFGDKGQSVRTLARNEILFEAGDRKTKVYRVESGALCIYRAHPDLRIEIVEHALAGDLVGLGFLDRHTASARATVDTKVRCFDLEDVDDLVENDPHNKSRFHDAVESEFAFRRESIVSSARERPIVRLAAFLLAVSRRIEQEGGDPTFVDDTVDCVVIADFLGLSVDLLALGLMQLEMNGLVETAPHHGLRLKDIPTLEAIAAEQVNLPDAWSARLKAELCDVV